MKHACILLVLVAAFHTSGRAEPLGRLFFSSAERALRHDNRGEKNTTAVGMLRLDGMVSRSAGPSTVWLDGRPQQVGRMPRTGSGTGGTFFAPIAGRPGQIALRVGESIDRGTGQRKDLVQAGAIRIGTRHDRGSR